MVSEFLYACTKPPASPLRRVTLYYLGLGATTAALAVWFPQALEFASQGPIDLSRVGGDAFEAVAGSEPMMMTQLEASTRLMVSLMAALLLMLPISWVYMAPRAHTGFDQSVVQTMIVLPIAVAGIVTLVHDSIALAFSLAGIVAGVRFRNTLKDTADALYIFAAIGIGLACGIGALAVAAVVSMFFNLMILLLWRCDYGACPQGGPKEEFSSGLMLRKVGEFDGFYAEKQAEVAKKTTKKKRKKKAAKAPKHPVIDADAASKAGSEDVALAGKPS